VLNQHGRICDATIANIFFVKGDAVYTPQLSEGCVNGVMRKYILQQLVTGNRRGVEGSFTIEEVQMADEIFFTNAMYGIRWVKQWGNQKYSCNMAANLFKQLIVPLFANV
jgi:branched-chain amino acid aminotransferase